VEGDEIARTFPDSFGCGTGALGGSFADVSCAACEAFNGYGAVAITGELRVSFLGVVS
jgi:hypothetical protein